MLAFAEGWTGEGEAEAPDGTPAGTPVFEVMVLVVSPAA